MGRINFVERGSGRRVLILHGGKLDHRHMVDAVEPVFAGRDDWRRTYIDLPGCGESAGHSTVSSQDDILAEVARFMETNDGGEKWTILGESRGSYIAQGLAYTLPEKIDGLGLIVPGGFPGDDQPLLPAKRALVAAPEMIAGLEPSVRARADFLVVQTSDIVAKIRDLKVPAADLHDPALEARVQEQFLFSFHEKMLTSRYDGPTLILSGRQDSISGYADAVRMLESYPRATFALLDCAGHSLSWERPDVFRSLMRDWLARLEQNE